MSRASYETYKRVESEGVLSFRRFQVYSALWSHECERPDIGLTHNEISHYVDLIYHFPEGYRNNSVARLCELEKQGVVCRTGDLVCPRSGDLCTTWMTVDRLPIDFERVERKRFWILEDEDSPLLPPLVFRTKKEAEHAKRFNQESTLIEVMEVRKSLTNGTCQQLTTSK